VLIKLSSKVVDNVFINEKSMCIITKWVVRTGEVKIVNLNPANEKAHG
jgi:hypothetical protein